ncbi:MAG: PIN domain-containing protein, partial [archaeon]
MEKVLIPLLGKREVCSYMQKTFVLDTNVLLHEPNALYSFGDNKVVLTEAVLEELDTFKKGHKEINAN